MVCVQLMHEHTNWNHVNIFHQYIQEHHSSLQTALRESRGSEVAWNRGGPAAADASCRNGWVHSPCTSVFYLSSCSFYNNYILSSELIYAPLLSGFISIAISLKYRTPA